jgi:epoxyqueuosine reductase
VATLAAIDAAAAAEGLAVFGAFHPEAEDGLPDGVETLVLLGPAEPGFWDRFTASEEYRDGAADPLDRWSARVIGALADAFAAEPLFPFGGPPYRPFIRWALRSGRAWVSPVGLLVHDVAGLMVSYRGALALGERLDLPAPPGRPCETCADKPCLDACPAGALTEAGYDVPGLQGWLGTGPGKACYDSGCAVRRACPVSDRYGRQPAQSAFHMRAFHR